MSISNAPAKLQIKLLSPAGQLLNVISCFRGQVTVLRAASHLELQPYQRILGGIVGPERLVVSLDGEVFRPAAHELVGYGERFLATDGSAAEYLIRNGVPEDLVDSLLITYGLENAFHTQCTLLSKCEERRLRLIAAVYVQSSVIVLNSPFDPIAHEWREKFAELIISAARSRGKIVVVPFLSYRPECWIDNDCVARIQVGDNIQKTVGFKKGGNELGDLVKQLRSAVKDDADLRALISESADPDTAQADQGSTPAAGSSGQILDEAGPHSNSMKTHDGARAKESAANLLSASLIKGRALTLPVFRSLIRIGANPRMAASLFLAAVTFALASVFWQPGTARERSPASSSADARSPAATSSQQVTALIDKAPQDLSKTLPPELSQAAPGTNRARASDGDKQSGSTALAVAYSLDLYPARVKDAVIDTFEQRSQRSTQAAQGPLRLQQSSSIDTPNRISGDDAGEFLRLLQFAGSDEASDETAEGSDDRPPPAPYIDGEPTTEDERREQIRQKFLEAIQRAQDRRGEEVPKF